MLDELKVYAQLVNGLTEVPRQKALDLARALLAQGMELASKGPNLDQMSDQVQGLADDLVSQSKANRDLLISLVTTEVDKAVGRMGLVREEELAALRARVAKLETEGAAPRKAATKAAPIKKATPPKADSAEPAKKPVKKVVRKVAK